MGVSTPELGGERGLSEACWGERAACHSGTRPLSHPPRSCGGLAQGSASLPSSRVVLGEGGLRSVWGLPGAPREGLVSSNPPK